MASDELPYPDASADDYAVAVAGGPNHTPRTSAQATLAKLAQQGRTVTLDAEDVADIAKLLEDASTTMLYDIGQDDGYSMEWSEISRGHRRWLDLYIELGDRLFSKGVKT